MTLLFPSRSRHLYDFLRGITSADDFKRTVKTRIRTLYLKILKIIKQISNRILLISKNYTTY